MGRHSIEKWGHPLMGLDFEYLRQSEGKGMSTPTRRPRRDFMLLELA